MSKAKEEVPREVLELYEKLVATIPEVTRKGATVPYTAVNGNMFSYLSKTGTLALRLPPAAREAFIRRYKAKLYAQDGVVQNEYVEVPDALLRKTAELRQFFALSFEYVRSLPPKPSTRKKAR